MKSKIFLVIVISLLVSTSFYSCDKPSQLEGTLWHYSGYVEFYDEHFNSYSLHNITIHFESFSQVSINMDVYDEMLNIHL